MWGTRATSEFVSRARSLLTTAAITMSMLAASCRGGETNAPDLEALINAHLEGDYDRVLRWCPTILDDRELGDEATRDWCMVVVPAAMRLSRDTVRAQQFVEAVCVDAPTGRAKGSEGFRTHYVREIARWVGLAMRAQRREDQLNAAVESTTLALSPACRVDPGDVALGIDTEILRGRQPARRP